MASKAGLGIALQEAGKGLMQYTQYNIEDMRQKNLEAIRQRERGEDIAWRESRAAAEDAQFKTKLDTEERARKMSGKEQTYRQILSSGDSQFLELEKQRDDVRNRLASASITEEVAAAELSQIRKREQEISNDVRARGREFLESNKDFMEWGGYSLPDVAKFSDEAAAAAAGAPGGSAGAGPVSLTEEQMNDPKVRQDAAKEFNRFLKDNPGKTEKDAIDRLKELYGPNAEQLVVLSRPSTSPAAPAGSPVASAQSAAAEKPESGGPSAIDQALAPRKFEQKTGVEATVEDPFVERAGASLKEGAKAAARNVVSRVDEVRALASNVETNRSAKKLERELQYAGFVAGQVKRSKGMIQRDAIENLSQSSLTKQEMLDKGLKPEHVDLVMADRAKTQPQPNPARNPAAPVQQQQPAGKPAREPAGKPTAKLDATAVEQIITTAAQDAGIIDQVDILKRMADTETKGQEDRATAVSPKGAIGLLQLKPGSSGAIAQLKKDGVIGDDFDPRDPVQNARAAAHYFKYLLGQFDGNLRAAVAAYNGGEGRVAAAMKNNPTGWENDLPDETKNYLKKVLA